MTQIGHSTTGHRVDVPGCPEISLVISWGTATDVGKKRAHNEDSLVAMPPIFAVADGMGGHSAGDIASAAVVSRLAEAMDSNFTEVDAIERGLREATGDIALAADEKRLGVGTTVTGAALTLHAGRPYWTVFNVGDSRVYMFEANQLSQVSVDHSVVQELVDSGAISAKDAENHPESNVITRAVGFNVDAFPDYWMLPLRTGLRLLLCSDGLTKEVSDERIRLHLAAQLSPSETAQALVDAAFAAGGRDNITTVVVDIVECSGVAEPGFSRSSRTDA